MQGCIGAGRVCGAERCSDESGGDVSTGLAVAHSTMSGNGDGLGIDVFGKFVESFAGSGVGVGSGPVGKMDIDIRGDDAQVDVVEALLLQVGDREELYAISVESFGSATEGMDVGICGAVVEGMEGLDVGGDGCVKSAENSDNGEHLEGREHEDACDGAGGDGELVVGSAEGIVHCFDEDFVKDGGGAGARHRRRRGRRELRAGRREWRCGCVLSHSRQLCGGELSAHGFGRRLAERSRRLGLPWRESRAGVCFSGGCGSVRSATVATSS